MINTDMLLMRIRDSNFGYHVGHVSYDHMLYLALLNHPMADFTDFFSGLKFVFGERKPIDLPPTLLAVSLRANFNNL